jgi:hypothetical protein
LASAEQSRAAAVTVKEAAESIVSSVNASAKSIWRPVRLWIYVVIFLSSALALTLIGTRAFISPAAIAPEVGGVQVAVSMSAPASPGYLNPVSPVYAQLRAEYSGDGNEMKYFVTVPAVYAGRKLILLLESSAMLNDPKTDGGKYLGDLEPADHREFVCRNPAITPWPHVLLGGPKNPCQMITVQLPEVAKDKMSGEWCGGNESSNMVVGGDGIAVMIAGQSHVRTQTDLFHERLDLPGLMSTSDSFNKWYTIQLDGWLRTLTLDPCLVAYVSLGDEVTDAGDVPADYTASGARYWAHPDYERSLVTRDRDAERWGNLALPWPVLLQRSASASSLSHTRRQGDIGGAVGGPTARSSHRSRRPPA